MMIGKISFAKKYIEKGNLYAYLHKSYQSDSSIKNQLNLNEVTSRICIKFIEFRYLKILFNEIL